jgi:hypothetical protein
LFLMLIGSYFLRLLESIVQSSVQQYKSFQNYLK